MAVKYPTCNQKCPGDIWHHNTSPYKSPVNHSEHPSKWTILVTMNVHLGGFSKSTVWDKYNTIQYDRAPLYETSMSAIKTSRISTLKKYTPESFSKCFSQWDHEDPTQDCSRQLDQNSRNHHKCQWDVLLFLEIAFQHNVGCQKWPKSIKPFWYNASLWRTDRQTQGLS